MGAHPRRTPARADLRQSAYRRHPAPGWFACPENSCKHRWKSKFSPGIDRAFGDGRTLKHISVPSCICRAWCSFETIDLLTRLLMSHRDCFRFGMVDLLE